VSSVTAASSADPPNSGCIAGCTVERRHRVPSAPELQTVLTSLHRIKPRRARPPKLRTAYRYIGKFLTRSCAAKHHAAAAHIAAPDEFGGKQQPLVEHSQQGRCVLGAGHTSEKHEQALMTGGAVDRLCRREQSVVVRGIVFVHLDLRGGSQLFRAEDRFGRQQTQAGHNHQGVRRLPRARAERGCVCNFPSEIQPADEAVDFAERGAAGTEFDRKLEPRFIVCEDRVAASAGPCGRQKKDTGRQGGQMKLQTPFRPRILWPGATCRESAGFADAREAN
jgi:hypothetical protein